jgi:high-affinity Fe2+/Pb2+ permease
VIDAFTTFGPLSSANKEPSLGFALFLIGLGLYVLIYLWYRYLTAEDEKQKSSLEAVIAISSICFAFIGTGIWELIRVFRISN